MRITTVVASLLAAGMAQAQEAPEQVESETAQARIQEEAAAAATTESGAVKTLSGMSILGNEEAPKSLVIVPWKSSQIGDGIGVDNALDDAARPVDKEVFMRELRYYELRAGSVD